MKESLSVPGHIKPQELRERIPHKEYNIVFEPGSHRDGDDYKAMLDGYINGEPTHDWNSQLAGRVSSYQPHILTIDGAHALSEGSGANEREIVYQKTDIWLGIPDNPQRINDSGVIHVVIGDQLSPSALEDGFTDKGEPQLGRWLSSEIERDSGTQSYTPHSDRALGLGVTGSIIAGAYLLDKARQKDFTRRGIIGGLVTSVAALTANVYGASTRSGELAKRMIEESAEIEIAYTQTTEDKDALMQVYDMTASQSVKPWLGARNALYVLKTKGAYDRLDIPSGKPAAIVAGFDHITGVSAVLQDDNAANEALTVYTRKLFRSIDTYYTGRRNFSRPQLPRDDARQVLVESIARTQIHRVEEPDATMFKMQPGLATDQAVTLVDTYLDQRTYKALEPLLE